MQNYTTTIRILTGDLVDFFLKELRSCAFGDQDEGSLHPAHNDFAGVSDPEGSSAGRNSPATVFCQQGFRLKFQGGQAKALYILRSVWHITDITEITGHQKEAGKNI